MSVSQDAPKCRVSSVRGVSSVKWHATAMLGKSCVFVWVAFVRGEAERRVCVCCVECVCVWVAFCALWWRCGWCGGGDGLV